jgi:hypothetical protein
MSTLLHAYGCGSPIRLPIVEALASGSGANQFISDPNPVYQGGDSIVWGLIRGADEIMSKTKENKCDFFQIDNAYFGRNIYYRVTLNALQFSRIPPSVINNRYELILNQLNKPILPWKVRRNGPIIICPSSEFLYSFFGTTLEDWINSVIDELKKFTDRKIVIRYKEMIPKDDIDDEISDAWCVITHMSAAALDALRLGIPVVVTGECAASPLSSNFEEIERPRFFDGRNELFSLLACGQFTPEEMLNQKVLTKVRDISELIR